MHAISQKHYGEACRRHAYNNCVFRGYLRSFAFSFSFDFIDDHLKIFMRIAQTHTLKNPKKTLKGVLYKDVLKTDYFR